MAADLQKNFYFSLSVVENIHFIWKKASILPLTKIQCQWSSKITTVSVVNDVVLANLMTPIRVNQDNASC